MKARSPFVHAVGAEAEPDPWREAAETLRDGRVPPIPPTLSHLAACFGLSEPETTAILLAAAHELGAPGPEPTVRMALDQGLGWEALATDAPLRRWRLLEPCGAGPLAAKALRLDERILQHLLGSAALDRDLALLCPIVPGDVLAPSHQTVAEELSAAAGNVVLAGCDTTTRRAIVAAAAARLGVRACRLADVPREAEARAMLALLWSREARLAGGLLLVESGEDAGLARDFHERCEAGTVLGGDALDGSTLRAEPLCRAEQAALWAAGGASDPRVLASAFDLSPSAIAAAVRDPGGPWEAARSMGRSGLTALADVIEPRAGWKDLVLPPATLAQVRMVAAQARARGRVFDEWKAARDPSRGAGLSALFAGPSGTGKTLAAEIIAGDLGVDLARIDLSRLVSKYIGETEKNIARAAAAAEAAGAVLLFDEADALFGKRSEVKDAHDRHANVEVSYLLQRMEDYRGLAILTSNLPDHLDEAFLRRLRLIVNFPPPEAEERARIWKRAFPKAAPLAKLSFDRLAQLQVTGGVIRNIALTAMFLAADRDSAVTMALVHEATRAEYDKLGRTLYPAEVEGWGA